jgi:hypothetical protein
MLAEARDPTTPPERLRLLCQGAAREMDVLQAALAANPNTPADLLIYLMSIVPAQVILTNPVLPLLPLEIPDLAHKIADRAAAALLRQAAAPPGIVALLTASRDRTTADAARLHVSLAAEAAPDEWESEVRAYWRNEVQSADYRARQAHLEMVELGVAPAWIAGPPPWPGPGVPEAPERLLKRALNSGDTGRIGRVKAALGACPNPDKLATHAVRAREPDVTLALLLNPAVPEAVKERMVLYSEAHQVAAASDLEAPAERLLRIAGETRHPWVRRIVGKHPTFRRNPELQDSLRAHWHRAALSEYRWNCPAPLATFIALMLPDTAANQREKAASATEWWRGLAVALTLDPHQRQERHWLNILARDGNRLIRAAARARLADPTRPFRL